jgi:hypothetical protein
MAQGVKLDEGALEDIARLAKEGKTGNQIAKDLKIARSTVQAIVKQLREGSGAGHGPLEALPRCDAPIPTTMATLHPFTELFPSMAEAKFAAFKADIAAHGVREPIWLYEDRILDGRNRHHACQELGLECPTRVYEGNDPVGFILSLNLHRRHLTESQRAMVAARIANMPEGGYRRTADSANLQSQRGHISQAQAAELLHVSPRSVAAAHKVQAEAQLEVIHAVEGGHMAVSAAAALAKQPVSVQRDVALKMANGEVKTVAQALKQIKEETNGHGSRDEPTPDYALPVKQHGTHWEEHLEDIVEKLKMIVEGFDDQGGIDVFTRTWTPEHKQRFFAIVRGDRVYFRLLELAFEPICEPVTRTADDDDPTIKSAR